MLLKPRLQDFKIIGYYLGKIIIGLGMTMLLPIMLGLFLNELSCVLDFIIALEFSLIIGFVLTELCFTQEDLSWMQGMVIVALSWVVAMFLGAIPLYLSGHWRCFLDACFEAMSGFATTGLSLVQDLDHLSYTHNFWRHLMMFVGGQGIVIVGLAFFVRGFSGAFRMYVGEARDERVLPNVISTARFIWLVSIVYLILGTVSLSVIGIFEGMKPFNAFFHGLCLFMAAYDTGGFAPQSQNMLYYHSVAFELVAMFLMVIGAINFKLHYVIWMGKRKEIWKDIETRVFFFSLMILFLIISFGQRRIGAYPQAVELFRKGFFQLISAHTGTGHQNIYPQQWISDWSQLSLSAVIMAMALGGAVCSTTGAIKLLRVGIIFKSLVEDVKRMVFSEHAVLGEKFYHLKDVFLNDKQARTALTITLIYFIVYFFGAVVGMFFGNSFLDSLFESTSAAANVGLSCGITQAGMPVLLKLVYIVQMWAGRLEFVSVFTLIGFLVAILKGRR